MKITQTNNNYGGIGFLGALCLLLVALKLLGVITWSWWAVTAPLWFPWLMLFVIFFGVFLGVMVSGDYKSWKKKL